MCVESSTPDISRAGDCHVSEIALMALDLLAGVVVFQVQNIPNCVPVYHVCLVYQVYSVY